MNLRPRLLVVSVAATAVLFTASCGKVAEKAGEAAGEKILEESTGAKDVEISKDGIAVKSEDGSTFESKTSTEMPEDLPQAPMFDGYTLQSSTKLNDNSNSTWMLAGTVKDPKAAFQGLVKSLKAAGWEVGTEMETSNPDYSAIGTATKGDLDLNFGTTGGSEKSFYYWLAQSK